MTPFTEKQKFTQWWIWAGLLAITCFIIYKIFILQNHRGSFATNPDGFRILIFSSLLPLFLIVLFYFISLETEIDERGITYKFFPFHLKKHMVPWQDIDKAFVRKYNPITEYGGWGFRLGIFGSGRALNISGNMGLQLVLKNGKRLLIGTQKPDEIAKILLDIKNQRTS